MDFIYFLEILGTIAFAVSGAYTAIEKKMDIFGVVILGTTTAVGGGIIRDVILNSSPPIAFKEPSYALTAVLVSLILFLPRIRPVFKTTTGTRILLIADSLGLGIFTVVGVLAGLPLNNKFLGVFVGVVTGVGGGVIRDLFAGNTPYIFVKHIYACASFIGAVIMVFFSPYNIDFAMVAGVLTILILRLLSAKYKWNLPRA